MSPRRKPRFGTGGHPGNAGGGLKPVPRALELEERYLHPETIAETLGTGAGRVRDQIEAGRLRAAFSWRGVPFVAVRELEAALLEGRLEGSSAGVSRAVRGGRGKGGYPDTSEGEIAPSARPERVVREPVPRSPGIVGNLRRDHVEAAGSVAPDFARTIPATRLSPYQDGRRLPPLPANWETVLGSTGDVRLVGIVRALWIDGISPAETAERLAVSEGTVRNGKRRALELLGI